MEEEFAGELEGEDYEFDGYHEEGEDSAVFGDESNTELTEADEEAAPQEEFEPVELSREEIETLYTVMEYELREGDLWHVTRDEAGEEVSSTNMRDIFTGEMAEQYEALVAAFDDGETEVTTYSRDESMDRDSAEAYHVTLYTLGDSGVTSENWYEYDLEVDETVEINYLDDDDPFPVTPQEEATFVLEPLFSIPINTLPAIEDVPLLWTEEDDNEPAPLPREPELVSEEKEVVSIPEVVPIMAAPPVAEPVLVAPKQEPTNEHVAEPVVESVLQTTTAKAAIINPTTEPRIVADTLESSILFEEENFEEDDEPPLIPMLTESETVLESAPSIPTLELGLENDLPETEPALTTVEAEATSVHEAAPAKVIEEPEPEPVASSEIEPQPAIAVLVPDEPIFKAEIAEVKPAEVALADPVQPTLPPQEETKPTPEQKPKGNIAIKEAYAPPELVTIAEEPAQPESQDETAPEDTPSGGEGELPIFATEESPEPIITEENHEIEATIFPPQLKQTHSNTVESNTEAGITESTATEVKETTPPEQPAVEAVTTAHPEVTETVSEATTNTAAETKPEITDMKHEEALNKVVAIEETTGEVAIQASNATETNVIIPEQSVKMPELASETTDKPMATAEEVNQEVVAKTVEPIELTAPEITYPSTETTEALVAPPQQLEEPTEKVEAEVSPLIIEGEKIESTAPMVQEEQATKEPARIEVPRETRDEIDKAGEVEPVEALEAVEEEKIVASQTAQTPTEPITEKKHVASREDWAEEFGFTNEKITPTREKKSTSHRETFKKSPRLTALPPAHDIVLTVALDGTQPRRRPTKRALATTRRHI